MFLGVVVCVFLGVFFDGGCVVFYDGVFLGFGGVLVAFLGVGWYRVSFFCFGAVLGVFLCIFGFGGVVVVGGVFFLFFLMAVGAVGFLLPSRVSGVGCCGLW